MLKSLLEFLSLGVIIGALPNNITNGNPIDATPLMADLNWIVNQVNANAAAAGSGGEWNSPGVSPSFISATQFSVPGDLRTTFDVRRRVLLTVTAVNGGATIVTTPTFGAGITTVTVNTDTVGFLTAGLTAVQYAVADAAILSAPRKTNLYVATTTTGHAMTSGGGNNFIGSGNPFPADSTVNDIFSELSAGAFTAKVAGQYLVSAGAVLFNNGAAVTTDPQLFISINGTSAAGVGTIVTVPSVHINAFWTMNCSGMVNLAVGDVVRADCVSPTFTGGPVNVNGGFFSIAQQF